MTPSFSLPPLRDLPPGRKDQREQHLLAEISRRERRRLTIPSPFAPERRVFVLAGTGACMAAVIALGVIVGFRLTNHSSGIGQAIATAGPVRTQTSGTVPTVSISANADFSVLYSSIDQLARDAEIIVRGNVTDVSYFDAVGDSAGQTYTKVTLNVTKSLKGGFEKGTTLMFLEIGGMTTEATIKRENGELHAIPITPADKNTRVQMLFEGAPLPRVGDDVVYFGARGDIGIIGGHISGVYYQSLGAFQGKFVIADGMAARYVPKSMLSDKFGALRMSVVELEKKVRDALSTPRTTDTSPSSPPARSTPSK